MKKIVTLILLTFTLFFTPHLFTESSPLISVCFTPSRQCTDLIVKELDKPRETVLVQAYSFTSAPIAKALTKTYRRSVKVQAILDKSNATAKYSSAVFLLHAGIPTMIDSAHAIAHNKIRLIRIMSTSECAGDRDAV